MELQCFYLRIVNVNQSIKHCFLSSKWHFNSICTPLILWKLSLRNNISWSKVSKAFDKSRKLIFGILYRPPIFTRIFRVIPENTSCWIIKKTWSFEAILESLVGLYSSTAITLECEASVLCSIHSYSVLIRCIMWTDNMLWPGGHYGLRGGGSYSRLSWFGICGAARSSDQGT